jgi:hypothetical protein
VRLHLQQQLLLQQLPHRLLLQVVLQPQLKPWP